MVDNVSEGSAAVAQNLENADKVQDMREDALAEWLGVLSQ